MIGAVTLELTWNNLFSCHHLHNSVLGVMGWSQFTATISFSEIHMRVSPYVQWGTLSLISVKTLSVVGKGFILLWWPCPSSSHNSDSAFSERTFRLDLQPSHCSIFLLHRVHSRTTKKNCIYTPLFTKLGSQKNLKDDRLHDSRCETKSIERNFAKFTPA